MISPLCAKCNKPEWAARHSVDHPVNRKQEDVHAFVVPGTKLVLPTVDTEDTIFGRPWTRVMLDLVIVGVAFSMMLGVINLIDGMFR